MIKNPIALLSYDKKKLWILEQDEDKEARIEITDNFIQELKQIIEEYERNEK